MKCAISGISCAARFIAPHQYAIQDSLRGNEHADCPRESPRANSASTLTLKQLPPARCCGIDVLGERTLRDAALL